MFSSSTAAAAQQQEHSSSGGGYYVELLFLAPAPRIKPERRMKKMEHRSGTFFRDSRADYALRISMADRPPRCIADRGTAEAAAQQQRHRSSSTGAAAQEQQHSSSDGSDVAATDEKDERGFTGELFVFVLALWRNLKRTSADTPRSLQLTTAVLLCR